jgi:hypothetical protein
MIDDDMGEFNIELGYPITLKERWLKLSW